MVASVRFLYYFKKEKRIELLRIMAEVTRKYVLVQYRTPATSKGRLNRKQAHSSKQFCSIDEILEEVEVARLDYIKILPISPSPLSDKVFVMARNRK